MNNTSVTGEKTYLSHLLRSFRNHIYKIDVIFFSSMILCKLLYFNFMITGKEDVPSNLMAASIGTVLVLICWTFFLPSASRTSVLLLIDCAITFVVLSDLVFFRYFSDIISMPVLMQASQVGAVKSSVTNLFSKKDVLLIADLLVGIPILYMSFKYRNNYKKKPIVINVIKAAILFTAGMYLITYAADKLEKNQPKILSSMYDRSFVVQNIGVINYHGYDAIKYVKDEQNSDKEKLSPQTVNEIEKWFLDVKKNKPKNPELFGAGEGKNLIVIQVEALQEFVINKKVNGMEVTPNLNKLIKESMYFDNYLCETGLGGTSDAEFIANVSLFPIKDGSAYMRYSGNNFVSLPKVMKSEGYNTLVMHAFKPGFWNRSVMYPQLGFNRFYNKADYNHDEVIGMGVGDKSFLRQSLEYLKKEKKPYYAFMITLSSHYPYNNDKKYYSPFDTGKHENTFFGNYLEAVHYTDESLGYFIDQLKENKMLDDTVIAIYGDHYAISKDKKDVLSDFVGIKDMNDFNWVKLQKVPMLIRLPGGENAGVKNIHGGGVDFMPTILNIMGIDGTTIPMMGNDLLNTKEGMGIMRNRYFTTSEYLSLTPDAAAFDIKSGERIPMEKVKDKINYVDTKLNYSEIMIRNDLQTKMEEFLKNSLKSGN